MAAGAIVRLLSSFADLDAAPAAPRPRPPAFSGLYWTHPPAGQPTRPAPPAPGAAAIPENLTVGFFFWLQTSFATTPPPLLLAAAEMLLTHCQALSPPADYPFPRALSLPLTCFSSAFLTLATRTAASSVCKQKLTHLEK